MKFNKASEMKYLKAIKKIQEVKIFYTHVTLYLIVNSLLLFINYNYFSNFYWALFLLIAWGTNLIFSGIKLFTEQKVLFGFDWEKRMIEEFMNKDKF